VMRSNSSAVVSQNMHELDEANHQYNPREDLIEQVTLVKSKTIDHRFIHKVLLHEQGTTCDVQVLWSILLWY
jgi:hypothetical protein